jgi:hypothetical protein
LHDEKYGKKLETRRIAHESAAGFDAHRDAIEASHGC